MKGKLNIFKRIIILIFVLITVLSLLFIVITYLTTKEFYSSTTQLTDKDVAAHIAKFASPFQETGINKKLADSVFYNAMVLNPSIEVYFLDTTGKIMYYQSPDSAIKLWKIPLENIRQHIASNGEDYIKGPDPKHPAEQKVFSAAEVINQGKKVGYIYVILGGNAYSTASNMLFESHVMNLAIIAFCVIIFLSVILSLLYVNRLQRSFNKIIIVLNKYMQGDLSVRFDVDKNDEFAPITDSFNKLATRLSNNIEKLTQTEQERKNFIATISHDLRTPLSVAKGYTETAIDKIQRDNINKNELHDFIQLVHKKLEQIELMVQDLFELSRMESVHFTANKEPFIFSEILNEMLNVYKKTAAIKNIQIVCQGCEDMSWITADIRLIERVIQNLLDNAVKYTPVDGNIAINLEKKQQILSASFTNTGNALSNELTKWINLAAQDNNINDNKPLNTGLGLLIVKKILALHHYSFQSISGKNNQVSFIIHMQTTNPLTIS